MRNEVSDVSSQRTAAGFEEETTVGTSVGTLKPSFESELRRAVGGEAHDQGVELDTPESIFPALFEEIPANSSLSTATSFMNQLQAAVSSSTEVEGSALLVVSLEAGNGAERREETSEESSRRDFLAILRSTVAATVDPALAAALEHASSPSGPPPSLDAATLVPAL
jgi:hypothetical protein